MSVRVAIVGANGNLGRPLLDALVGAGNIRVTVLRRSSPRPPPASVDAVRVLTVSEAWTTEELTTLLRGEDVVIACFPLHRLDSHLRLADAAAAAGVGRLIPADFGSVDSRSLRAQELVPLFLKKVRVRERLESLASEVPGFTWTSLVGGHFFDWGLKHNFLHFDLAAKRADILDDGNQKSSLSTLARYCEAVLSVLSNLEATANKVLFIQSFCVSQNDVLAALERATGSEWAVERYGSDEFIKSRKEKANEGDLEAVEDLVFALGVVDGNWEGRPEFAMELLGLKDEILDEAVSQVVRAFAR